MITMGSKPIPLPYRSWDEVPPDQLQTIASINQSHATNAIAPERNWKKKTFMGIKLGTIVTIIIIILKSIALAENRREDYRINIPTIRTDFLHTIRYPEIRPNRLKWNPKFRRFDIDGQR